MLLQTQLRLAAPVSVAEPPQLRVQEVREVRPVEAAANGGETRLRSQGEQAAILHFGTQAAERAKGRGSDKPAALLREQAPERDASSELTPDEQQAVADLKQRDREVRAHEQTHHTVGGQYAGNVHLEYEVGPDGKRYATSGTTPIDVSPIPGDPAATLRKMEVVQRAATTPASPSSADRQVAAQAAQHAQKARAELAAQRYGSAHELAREQDEPAGSFPVPPPAPEAAPGNLLAVFG